MVRNIGRIFKYITGVLAVLVMSAAFSGYSVNNGYVSDIVCNTFFTDNPAADSSRHKEGAGAIKEMCTYFYNKFSPYAQVLENAADKYPQRVSVGEISTKIGEDNYILKRNAESENEKVKGDVSVVFGDGYDESVPVSNDETVKNENMSLINKLRQTMDTDFLIKNFYIVDSTTSVKRSYFKVKRMLNADFTMPKEDAPQILIYHTHGASESFEGSKEGVSEEGIIGVGDYLAEVLTDTYGYKVYHDRTPYDMIDGKIDRSLAYAKALPCISKILADNPSIKVIIDLHRDGVGKAAKKVTDINGKSTAKVMFFNGLSRSKTGARQYLRNDNLADNLAFSLQLKIKSMELYPDFAKPVYLKGYRYNLHLLPRSLLIELGDQNNTLEEAKNAVPPLADVLDAVLAGR